MPVGVALGGVLFGYSVFYYGLQKVLSGNWTYLECVWPGRFVPGVPRDHGSKVGAATSSSSTAAGSPPANPAQGVTTGGGPAPVFAG